MLRSPKGFFYRQKCNNIFSGLSLPKIFMSYFLLLCASLVFFLSIPTRYASGADCLNLCDESETKKLIRAGGYNDPLDYINWDKFPTDTYNWDTIDWIEKNGEYKVQKITAFSMFLSGDIDLANLTDMTILYLGGNELESVDVTGDTALEDLSLYYNNLRSLDISGNLSLKRLNVSHNNIETLDVSKNTALEELTVSNNDLRALDVSKNLALKILDIGSNDLSTIDISNNTALEYLDLESNEIQDIDVSKHTALQHLNLEGTELKSIDLTKNTALKYLDLRYNELRFIDLTKNTALEYLDISRDLLYFVDLSTLTKLETLILSENEFQVLDVSKNKALKILEISDNPLASLDLSNNIALEEVDVSKNELSSLILPKDSAQNDSVHSNTAAKQSDEPKEYTLKELDVSNNRFTLSQLYKFMSLNLTELTIGNQYFVELPALAGSAIVAGKAYDISTEIAFNGVPTDFTFFYNGKEADPLNDYTLKDGKLTFLKSGYYLIEMTNKEVYDISEHGPPSRESLVSTGVLTVERREEEVR